MSRIANYPGFALPALIILAFGCGTSDRPETTSASAGGTTPLVSETTSAKNETTGTANSVVGPITYEKAESTYDAGRYPEAAQLFTAYIESKPENPWGYYMLGMSAWRAGERDSAVTAFDRALELDPNHRKSFFNSARVFLEMGKPKEALERVEKALAIEPMSNEGVRLLGRVRHELGQVDGAIEAYHRALALDENDVWSMNNLGLIYIEQDRSSEALPPLARAVELRSNAPVFQNNLGIALERSGHPVAASKAYEAAIAVDSTYPKASASLARITAAAQPAESDSLDLAALSQQFQSEIQGWRDSIQVTGSDSVPSQTGPDSITGQIEGLSDSSRASVEAVSDSVEDCQQD